MKTIDIPLSRAMAKARREMRKKQTRRVVKGAGWDPKEYEWAKLIPHPSPKIGLQAYFERQDDPIAPGVRCPYGQPGDSLRWLTTWATRKEWDHLKPSRLPKDTNWSEHFWSFHDSDEKPDWCGRLRPGRFLPLFLRHLLPVDKVVAVRVERLQDIRGQDAIAEGIEPFTRKLIEFSSVTTFRNYITGATDLAATHSFRTLWESINGKGSWDCNDWVWVIEFERSK